MEDIQIAYYLLVILIGFAALAIAVFWTVKTRESDLRNFSIVYALFTLVLVLLVLMQYLFLNVETYSARSWYFIAGALRIVDFAVIIAAIHFLLEIYQIRFREVITFAFLLAMLACDVLIFSPIGAVLDVKARTIHLGIGYHITAVGYFVFFTFMLALGYGWLHRVWGTDKRDLIIGLLVFATFGYIETLLNLPGSLGINTVALDAENGFLFSSIPYAGYGIFLINYFLHYSFPAAGTDELTEAFLSKYGITDREREIILKVMQGKSNADIAGELFISLATVKTHLHNIYNKFGIDSRYDLLAKVRSGQ